MASRSPNPNSLIVVGEGTGVIPHSKRVSVSDKNKSQQKQSHESKLHVLSPKGDYVDNFFDKEIMSGSSSRPSSAASHARSGGVGGRLDSAGGRRSQTPTKTVTLQAVRRKDDSDFSGFENLDWKDKQSESPSRNINRPLSASSIQLEERLSDMAIEKKGSEFNLSASSARDQHDPNTIHTNNSNISVSSHVESTSVKKSPDLKADNSDDDDDDDDSEEEETKAPNELMMEFLTCLMEKDYKNAEKLCKMILIYEPDNADALKFQPLLEEKQKLDLEKANASSDDDSDDGVDDESDSDDDDDDSDSSDDSSSEEDSTDDEDEAEQEEATEKKVDSGIASASD